MIGELTIIVSAAISAIALICIIKGLNSLHYKMNAIRDFIAKIETINNSHLHDKFEWDIKEINRNLRRMNNKLGEALAERPDRKVDGESQSVDI